MNYKEQLTMQLDIAEITARIRCLDLKSFIEGLDKMESASKDNLKLQDHVGNLRAMSRMFEAVQQLDAEIKGRNKNGKI